MASGSGPSAAPVLIPTKGSPYPDKLSHLDVDDPIYLPADPATYVAVGLAYDVLATPACVVDDSGVSWADYAHMQPRLAERWTEGPGGEWTVQLKRGIRSHHGHELTAEDVAWRFEKSYQLPTTLGSWRWRDVVGVQRAVAVDSHTVRHELRSRNPTFPNWLLSLTPNLVDSKEVRRHATEADPWAINWLNGNVAGFGAYDLVSRTPAGLDFRARKDYWMGEPGVSAVEVRSVGSRAEGLKLLDEARPVLVTGLEPDEIAHFLRRSDVVIVRTWGGHTSVEINFLLPPFDDIRVRHALSYATPYGEVLECGLLGLAKPWRSPNKSASQWYTGEYWHYDTNQKKARDLLKDAGLRDGFSSELYLLASRPDCVRVGQVLQKAWREIGVDVELKAIEDVPAQVNPALVLRAECSHNVTEPIYDLAHDYAVLDPLLPPPGSKGVGTWHPRWERNEQFLDAYREMLLANDPVDKKRRGMDLQRMAVEFSSSIFLAEVQHATVVNKHVPPSFYAPDTHLFQQLQYQNPTARYLPGGPRLW